MNTLSPKKFVTLALATFALVGLGAATPAHASSVSSSLSVASSLSVTNTVPDGRTRVIWCS